MSDRFYNTDNLAVSRNVSTIKQQRLDIASWSNASMGWIFAYKGLASSECRR